MQINHELIRHQRAREKALTKYVDPSGHPKPLFSGGFCHSIEVHRLCPTPAETSPPTPLTDQAIHTANSKKIVKFRRKGRRYFKRRRASQLKDARLVRTEMARQRFEPDRYTFDAESEMRLMFAASRGFNKTLVFDLDGTLLPYCVGRKKHRQPKLRPHLSELVTALKDRVNLFVFSAGSPVRTQNLLKKYLPQEFSGYFDRSHLQRGRKNLNALKQEGHDVVLVDDDPDAVHLLSNVTHFSIKRWHGEDEDTELITLLHRLNEHWGCN